VSDELIPIQETSPQKTFDWDITFAETQALVQEDAELTSTIEEAMVRRFEVRVKIGFNLIALQEEHSKDGHGDFTTVELPKLGIERTFAHRCIRVARLYESSSVASLQRTNLPALPMSRWEQLASPSTHPQVIEQVLSGEIEATAQSIKEANERAKQAEQAKEEAEKQAATLQQQLTLFSELSQSKIDALTEQITELQEKIQIIQTPETVEVTPAPVLAQMEQMQAEIETLTAERARLADKTVHLTENIHELRKRTEDEREAARYAVQIKADWKKATETLYKACAQFVGSLPSPLDLHLFEAEEWARASQAARALEHVREKLRELLDARYKSVDAMVYEATLQEREDGKPETLSGNSGPHD